MTEITKPQLTSECNVSDWNCEENLGDSSPGINSYQSPMEISVY